jgi:hypothetical protein
MVIDAVHIDHDANSAAAVRRTPVESLDEVRPCIPSMDKYSHRSQDTFPANHVENNGESHVEPVVRLKEAFSFVFKTGRIE